MKDDTISRQLAIDKFAAYIYHAFKDFYRIGLHRKTLTPEQCRRVARNVLAEVPSVQSEQAKMIKEIRKWINSKNRGSADYFIVDKIEEIINKYEE